MRFLGMVPELLPSHELRFNDSVETLANHSLATSTSTRDEVVRLRGTNGALTLAEGLQVIALTAWSVMALYGLLTNVFVQVAILSSRR